MDMQGTPLEQFRNREKKLVSTEEVSGPFRGTCRAILKLVKLASLLQSVCSNHLK